VPLAVIVPYVALPFAIPLTSHVTAVFDVLVTLAVKEVVWEALNVAVVGVIVMVTALLLELPPPHPDRKKVGIIIGIAASATVDARRIRRGDTRDRRPQIPANLFTT
jgi:hypothetical protein